MSETKVVNLKHDDFDVYIGRPSDFGNPFPVGTDRKRCIQLFENYFLKRVKVDEEFKQKVLTLRGKKLGCYCKPQACHGDVIKQYIDQEGNKS